MVKKFLLSLFIMLAISVAIFLTMFDGQELILSYINRNILFLTENDKFELAHNYERVRLMENQLIIQHENVLEILDYNGKSIQKNHFDHFLLNVFTSNGIKVLTENNKIYLADGRTLIYEENEEYDILQLWEDGYTFILSNHRQNHINKLTITDTQYRVIGVIEKDNGRILSVQRSHHANAIVLTSFTYDGTQVISYIEEYLPQDGYPLWQTEFVNEIILGVEPRRDGIYLMTNKSVYKLNNQGDVLWKYGSFNQARNFNVQSGIIYFIEGKDQIQLHLISTDGKILERLELEHGYENTVFSEGEVLLSSSRFISHYKEGKVYLLLQSREPILQLLVDNGLIRLLTQDFVRTYRINRK